MTAIGSLDRSAGHRGGSLGRRLVVTGVVAFLAGIACRGFIADDTGRPEQRSAATAASSEAAPIGPTDEIDGMPAGFAHSEDGAVAAATAYISTGEELMRMDPLAVEDAIRQISPDSVADQRAREMVSSMAQVREVLRPGRGPISYRQAALAVHVEEYDDDAATVAVWNVGVLSREQVAVPQASWQITTVHLLWERGDWRVEEQTNAHGPAPVLSSSGLPATSAQLAEALDGFVPLLPGVRSEDGG